MTNGEIRSPNQWRNPNNEGPPQRSAPIHGRGPKHRQGRADVKKTAFALGAALAAANLLFSFCWWCPHRWPRDDATAGQEAALNNHYRPR